MKYVSLEVAKALKAAGFNIPTKAYYRTMVAGRDNPYVFHELEKAIDYNHDAMYVADEKREWFSAPTIDDGFRWLIKNSKQPVNNFNATHPELLFEDEIFLLNIEEEQDAKQFMPEKCCGVRVGRVAYDNKGEVVKYMLPVFGKLKK